MEIIIKKVGECYMLYYKFDNGYETPVILNRFKSRQECIDMAKQRNIIISNYK